MGVLMKYSMILEYISCTKISSLDISGDSQYYSETPYSSFLHNFSRCNGAIRFGQGHHEPTCSNWDSESMEQVNYKSATKVENSSLIINPVQFSDAKCPWELNYYIAEFYMHSSDRQVTFLSEKLHSGLFIMKTMWNESMLPKWNSLISQWSDCNEICFQCEQC